MSLLFLLAIYDDKFHIVRTGPVFQRWPLDWPLSISFPTVDGDLYVLDRQKPFQALIRKDVADFHDYLPHELQDPEMQSYRSYTVFGGAGGESIWFSEEGIGTYAFDVQRREWALPFTGLAVYVPDHKLWFGLSRKHHSKGNPLRARGLYSNLAHLGDANFCIVRVFARDKNPGLDFDRRTDEDTFAVLTAVEVVQSSAGLRMVKHKSVCYTVQEGDCVDPLSLL
uniref:Uncharacterized protein n=1 Tax=Leersia perrieri TaxID=77586 RepID=A0A0D9WKC1_9ORYZ